MYFYDVHFVIEYLQQKGGDKFMCVMGIKPTIKKKTRNIFLRKRKTLGKVKLVLFKT